MVDYVYSSSCFQVKTFYIYTHRSAIKTIIYKSRMAHYIIAGHIYVVCSAQIRDRAKPSQFRTILVIFNPFISMSLNLPLGWFTYFETFTSRNTKHSDQLANKRALLFNIHYIATCEAHYQI